MKKYLINITENETNIKQFDELTEDQDYFNLACSLFLLKYGIPIFKYANKTIRKSALMENINYIKNKRLPFKEFFSFTDNLINNALENKYSFDQIKRNKFWYKNFEYIEKIIYDYDNDEEKINFFTELQKQDFLMEKKKIFENNKKRELNEINMNKAKKRYKRYTRKNINFKK